MVVSLWFSSVGGWTTSVSHIRLHFILRSGTSSCLLVSQSFNTTNGHELSHSCKRVLCLYDPMCLLYLHSWCFARSIVLYFYLCFSVLGNNGSEATWYFRLSNIFVGVQLLPHMMSMGLRGRCPFSYHYDLVGNYAADVSALQDSAAHQDELNFKIYHLAKWTKNVWAFFMAARGRKSFTNVVCDYPTKAHQNLPPEWRK